MEFHEKTNPHVKKHRPFIVTLLGITLATLVVLVILRLHFPGCWAVIKLDDPFNRKAKSQQPDSKTQQVQDLKSDSPARYVVLFSLRYPKTGKHFLVKGDIVEVLHPNRRGLWLVRRISRRTKFGLVPRSFFKHLRSSKMESDDSEEIYPEVFDETPEFHIVLTNYQAKNENEVSVSIDDEIEVLDNGDTEYWFIDNLTTQKDGLVPSYLVQKVSEEQYRRVYSDSVKVKDTYNQRTNAVNDLVIGERKYVTMLRFLVENHVAEMDSDDLPQALRGKKEEIFSVIKDIHTFHSRAFLNELEGCVNDPDELPAVFLRYKNKLLAYSNYFKNRLKAELILNQQKAQDFFKEFQDDTEDPLFITDYLNKPLERMNEYKYSLQELLKYTARANLRCEDIEEALEVAATLSREANTVLHIASLESYTGEIPLQEAGKLHRQDTILFWDDKPRGPGKKRELLLFDKILINARIKNDGKKYLCKFAMKISSLELTENIDGEPKKWAVWIGNSVHNPVVLHTFEAKTVEAKDSWVDAIRELIENEGGRRNSRDEKTGSGRHGPALKERLETSVQQDDIFREVEKQYIIVTAPKVAPKIKAKPAKMKPEENQVNQFKEINIVLDLNGNLNKYVDTREYRGTRDDPAWTRKAEHLEPGDLSSPPKLTGGPHEVVAKIGSNAVFTCEFEGDPGPSAKWNKDGHAIENEGRFKINTTSNTGSLEIDDVVKTDAGSYQVVLQNQWGYAWASAPLVIAGTHLPPNMTVAPKGQVRRVGETAVFPCNFTAAPQPSITWTKDDVPIKTEGRYLITIKENYTSLEIDDIVRSDKGKYGVDLKNPYGSYSAWAGLVVTGADGAGNIEDDEVQLHEIQKSSTIETTNTDVGGQPPDVTNAPKGLSRKVGQTAIFPCNFTADPQPSIIWKKNNVLVKSEGRFLITIEDNFTKLEIDDLVKADAGRYSVSLTNPYGSYWAWAGLLVYGGEDDAENVNDGESTTERDTVVNSNEKASEESFFIEQLQDQEVAKWSALTLTVKINHSGAKPKITWKKDGKTVSTGRPKMAYDKGVATLKYTRVELADSGKYTVEIDTGKQKHDSSATVKVGDQSKSKTTNVPAAGKSALFANFKQQSAAQSSNASDNKITVEVKENAAQSEGNVQKTEANIATEKEVETESAESKKKQVNGGNAKGDSLFIEQLQDQQAKKWSAVTLTAKINDGVTKPKITWKKDGKPLGAGRARMTYDKGVATLKYPRIEYTDSGKYIVEVDTGSEKCESGATIEVADIPEPPFPPNAAEIKSTSMKVSWRASNTGNSPITSYVLEYRANSDKDWVPVTGDVTTTSYLLEDLTPKTQYRFRVSATNKLGTSKPSRTSNVFQSKA